LGRILKPGSATVVAKCANAACSAPFLYLREGKIFRMEFAVDRHPRGPVLAKNPKPVRKIEHLWLCGPCSTTLTLVMNGDRVETAPIDPVAFKAAAAS
jgi:hypothetical protein